MWIFPTCGTQMSIKIQRKIVSLKLQKKKKGVNRLRYYKILSEQDQNIHTNIWVELRTSSYVIYKNGRDGYILYSRKNLPAAVQLFGNGIIVQSKFINLY